MGDFKKRLTLTGAELPTALPHCFYVHSYRSPTKCHICKRLLKGLVKQGYRCKGKSDDEFSRLIDRLHSNLVILNHSSLFFSHFPLYSSLHTDCKMSVHKKCIPKATKNCRGLLSPNNSRGKLINDIR